MTAPRITEYDMDVHAEAIDEYARYGGLRPGMIPGPKTELPIPEPVETVWQATRRGWFAAAALLAIPTIIAAGLAIYLAVTGQLS